MKVDKELYETLRNLIHADLDSGGKELLNPESLVVHSDLNDPPSLTDRVRRIMRTDLSMAAHNQGHETFEESLDFDIGEDVDENHDPTHYEQMAEELPKIDAEDILEEKARLEHIRAQNEPEEQTTAPAAVDSTTD